jgi:hypothetical protein
MQEMKSGYLQMMLLAFVGFFIGFGSWLTLPLVYVLYLNKNVEMIKIILGWTLYNYYGLSTCLFIFSIKHIFDVLNDQEKKNEIIEIYNKFVKKKIYRKYLEIKLKMIPYCRPITPFYNKWLLRGFALIDSFISIPCGNIDGYIRKKISQVKTSIKMLQELKKMGDKMGGFGGLQQNMNNFKMNGGKKPDMNEIMKEVAKLQSSFGKLDKGNTQTERLRKKLEKRKEKKIELDSPAVLDKSSAPMSDDPESLNDVLSQLHNMMEDVKKNRKRKHKKKPNKQ